MKMQIWQWFYGDLSSAVQVERSYVVDAATGQAKMDPIRTSSGTFIRYQPYFATHLINNHVP